MKISALRLLCIRIRSGFQLGRCRRSGSDQLRKPAAGSAASCSGVLCDQRARHRSEICARFLGRRSERRAFRIRCTAAVGLLPLLQESLQLAFGDPHAADSVTVQRAGLIPFAHRLQVYAEQLCNFFRGVESFVHDIRFLSGSLAGYVPELLQAAPGAFSNNAACSAANRSISRPFALILSTIS